MGDNKPIRPDTEPSGAWTNPDDQERVPSPVTEAWAEEADARLAATQEWAESKVRAAAERRLAAGEAGALAETERRNWAEALEKERADRERERAEWASQVERVRKERDEWKRRAMLAELE